MPEASTLTVEAVRRRPAMYLGSLAHPAAALEEVLSNAFDEYLASRARHSEVTLHADAGVTIADDGGGIPRATIEGALRSPHDAATFDDHRPHVHLGGLRGLGLCVVAAVCSRFAIETVHAGHAHRWELARGVPTRALVSTPHAGPSGTRVRLAFDPGIFESVALPRVWLLERLEQLVDLSPGLRVTLRDEGHVMASPPRGILARVSGEPRIELSGVAEDTRVHLGLAWRPSFDERREPRIESFVNWQRTRDHGTHVSGMLDGLALAEAELKPRRPLRERLDACLLVVTRDVQWGSPTKDQLRSPGLRPLVAEIVRRELLAHLGEHPESLDALRARRFRGA